MRGRIQQRQSWPRLDAAHPSGSHQNWRRRQVNLQHACRDEGTQCHDLPDHLVGLKEERRGNREAQDLGGLEVNDQLKCRRLLGRKISGLAPFRILST